MTNLKTYLLLTGIFLISVLVRLPHLDRPLSKHHEFCTAIVLIPLQNWAENGASTYQYSPSITFEGTANHDIENLTAYPVEADGRYYYLSHPPFAYLLPYFCFWVLGVFPTPLALQVFNLLFHLLSCLLIYEIVKMLTTRPLPLKGSQHTMQKKWADSPLGAGGVGSLTAFLIYLFAPATLWFHGNTYMSDMFISNILILGIWVVLKAFLRKDKSAMPDTSKVSDILHIVSIAIVIFLMIYTEWLGNFFAFGVFILALIKAFSKKEKTQMSATSKVPDISRTYWLAIAGACVLGVVAGLGLIFWQYSSIAGFEAYWAYFSHRFGARSGAQFSDNGVFYFLWKYGKMTLRIGKHYATGFLPVLLLGGVLWGVLFFRTKKIFHPANVATRYFWWIAGFPILMHHLVFVEFTVVHDFAVLKGGILLAVGVGLLVDKLTHRKSRGFKPRAFAMSTPQPPPKGQIDVGVSPPKGEIDVESFSLNRETHVAEVFRKAKNLPFWRGGQSHYLPLWRGLGGGLLAMILLCIAQYYYINRPGEISQNGDRYDYMQTLGENIRSNAAANEVIFLKGYKPDPQVMYYARRNMLRAADPLEVRTILEKRGTERGVLFTIENYEIKRIERVKTNQK